MPNYRQAKTRKAYAGLALVALVAAAGLPGVGCQPATARNMWDINHGMTNPPMPAGSGAQSGQRGGAMAGGVPGGMQMPADLWHATFDDRIPAGTVLTTVLEKDLSSAKNQPGDVFALTVEHGFAINGKVLIPPKSKIVGAVNFVTPARNLKGGHPGRIEVSLQTLVFPDGRHTQIFGFIDSNPAQHQKAAPKVRHLGHSIADYGQSLTAMGMSFVIGPGFMAGKFNRGHDFHLDKGEVLPVRLNRDLEIPAAPPVIAQPPTMRGGADSGVPMAPGVPVTSKGYLDPHGPIRIPGFVPGTANGAAPGGIQPGTIPPDPNAIFKQPLIASPQSNGGNDPF